MADFALYQGLQNKSNIFETKAANRQMELQIQSQLEQRSQQKLEKQAEIDAKMQEFYNAVNDMDVLEQDKERIQAAEKRFRSDVINKVKQFNGNLEHFMYGGGAATLNQYQNNLMQSEEVENALANKMNYAQWMHAQANGLFVKDVGVEVPVVDEEGKIRMEPKKVSMDEAYRLFERGDIAKMPYDGAEKDVKVGPEMFQQIYKDPRNPYSDDTGVTAEDVYLWVRQHGGSDDQARAKMDKYTQYVNQGGTEWRYKSGDKMKLALQQQQLANARQKYKMNQAAMNANLGKNSILDFQRRIRNARPGEDVKLLPEEEKFFAQQLGFVYDKDSGRYTTTRDIGAFDRQAEDNPNPKKYSLRDFSSFYPEGYTIGANGEVMLKLRATSNPEFEEDRMPIGEWAPIPFGGFDEYGEGVHVNNWKQIDDSIWSNPVVEGNVYIPITDYYTNNFTQTYLNTEIGARSNQDLVPRRVSENERLQHNAQLLNDATNAIMMSTGADQESAGQMLYNWGLSGETGEGAVNPNLGGAQSILTNQTR